MQQEEIANQKEEIANQKEEITKLKQQVASNVKQDSFNAMYAAIKTEIAACCHYLFNGNTIASGDGWVWKCDFLRDRLTDLGKSCEDQSKKNFEKYQRLENLIRKLHADLQSHIQGRQQSESSHNTCSPAGSEAMDDVESNNEEMPALVPKVVQSNSDDFQVFVNDDFGKTMAVDVYPKMPVGVFVGMIGGLLEPTNEAELLIYFGPRRLEDGDSLQDVKTLEDYGIHKRTPPIELTVVGRFLGGMNKNGKFRDEKKFDDQLDVRFREMWREINILKDGAEATVEAKKVVQNSEKQLEQRDKEIKDLQKRVDILETLLKTVQHEKQDMALLATCRDQLLTARSKMKSFFEEARTFMTQQKTELKAGIDSLQAQHNNLKKLSERSLDNATEKSRQIHEKLENRTAANAENIIASNAVLKKMVVNSL
jgi:hypothetical protein